MLPRNWLRGLLPLFTCAALSAHDLYILPDAFFVTAKARLGVAFHNGDSFPESEAAPQPGRLRNAQLLWKDGSAGIDHLQIEGKRTTGTVALPATSGTFLLSVQTVPNLIELPPDKFLDYLKEEGLTEVIAWRAAHKDTGKPGKERYTKFAKAVLSSGVSGGMFPKPVGHLIEIIPLANPAALHAGAALPVQVLFRGKPAPDLQVEAAWAGVGGHETKPVGRTDGEGRIRVSLTNAGKWRLHSLHMERCTEPSVADWESSWASLTFEIR